MRSENDALLRDLLQWLAAEPRLYAEVMDAWRTSCPRLSIWEDAMDHGLLVRRFEDGAAMVHITDAGRAFLGTFERALERTA